MGERSVLPGMTVYVATVYYRHEAHDITGAYSTVELAVDSGHAFAKSRSATDYSIYVEQMVVDGGIETVKPARHVRVESEDE